MQNFSDYIVFVDESGDHGIKRLDPDYPIFVLVFMIIHKDDYIHKIVPAMQAFKFKYWGHDQVVLHENEIRKSKGDFTLLLTNEKLRKEFYHDLNKIVINAPVKVISVTLDKNTIKVDLPIYEMCYFIARFHLTKFLKLMKQEDKIIDIIAEMRGENENSQLEEHHSFIEFMIDHNDIYSQNLQKTRLRLVHKRSNSTGLQLADLFARPIGINYLKPEQENRAYDIIKEKLLINEIYPPKS